MQLHAANGPSKAVNEDKEFDVYYPTRGQVTTRELHWPADILDFSINPAGLFANAVRVEGASALTPTAVAHASIATDPRGRREKNISEAAIAQQTHLNVRDDYLLAQLYQDQPTVTVTLKQGIWENRDTFWLGDTLRLLIEDGGFSLDENLRVLKMDFNVSDEGYEKVAVTLGPKPLPYRSIWKQEAIYDAQARAKARAEAAAKAARERAAAKRRAKARRR